MKRLKLRGWVKSLLIILIIMTSFNWLGSSNNKAVEKCVELGNNRDFCISSLK